MKKRTLLLVIFFGILGGNAQGYENGDDFKNQQLQTIAEGEKKLEQYKAMGMVSDEDYAEAQANMAKAQAYLNSKEGTQLSNQLAEMHRAGESVAAKCEKFKSDQKAYSSCVQSAFKGFGN